MRYAALNQDADALSRHGDFRPVAAFNKELLDKLPPPTPADFAPGGRYSDVQLLALAKYVYALKPPANPNLPKTDADRERVALGAKVFTNSGCGKCHDPAQGYTNNKLVRAPGFTVPDDHPDKANILDRAVGTDPTLALRTRRGTGLYKVPSLQGVWYRGPFEHNGSVATLEDWFDPKRLEHGYVPTGWKGPPGTKTRAVAGHEFGVDLPTDDRKALIAFLKTL
jgi:cytochrome c peroxidase